MKQTFRMSALGQSISFAILLTKIAAAIGRLEIGAGTRPPARWAQANRPDYSYAVFSERARAAGCACYLVSFPGRRVVYYGRAAETYVEHFPS